MNRTNILLGLAGLLIFIGLTKPNISNILNPRPLASIDVLELPAPTDESILKEAEDVVKIAKSQMSKDECRKLRDLYIDIKQLIKLDGEEMVISNTEEIRQANSIAGLMLRMDIKGKYPTLSKELKEVIVAAVGDDQIVLSTELREKALEGFDALAWALNEGSK